MQTSLRSGRFTISFPGPTLQIKDGGMTGLNIHELRELGDLIQAALEFDGTKRPNKQWDKGSPSQDGALIETA